MGSLEISPLHLRTASEFHPCKVVHLPVEPISEEGMEDVCLQHLEWDQHLRVTIRLRLFIHS